MLSLAPSAWLLRFLTNVAQFVACQMGKSLNGCDRSSWARGCYSKSEELKKTAGMMPHPLQGGQHMLLGLGKAPLPGYITRGP